MGLIFSTEWAFFLHIGLSTYWWEPDQIFNTTPHTSSSFNPSLTGPKNLTEGDYLQFGQEWDAQFLQLSLPFDLLTLVISALCGVRKWSLYSF